MKKLVVPIVLLLIVVLATGALGCDKVKGSGVFYDEYTENPVEFKVNLVAGKTNGSWTDVMGSIHLDDEAQGVKVRGAPWMRFWESSNNFMAWDVHVNGEKCDFLDFTYYENWDPPWFWIMIIDDGKKVYEWWGWEDDVEWDIKIID
jgi:hypothetical protein